MGTCPFICWAGFLVLASSLGDSGCLSFHRMISTAQTDWWHTVLFPESSQCLHSVQQTRTSSPSAGSHRQFADNLEKTQVKSAWQVIVSNGNRMWKTTVNHCLFSAAISNPLSGGREKWLWTSFQDTKPQVAMQTKDFMYAPSTPYHMTNKKGGYEN